MSYRNVKLTCPLCNKEMQLLEIQWTGRYVFECEKCGVSASFEFYGGEHGEKKLYRHDLEKLTMSKKERGKE